MVDCKRFLPRRAFFAIYRVSLIGYTYREMRSVKFEFLNVICNFLSWWVVRLKSKGGEKGAFIAPFVLVAIALVSSMAHLVHFRVEIVIIF